jgi:hypothetical protein
MRIFGSIGEKGLHEEKMDVVEKQGSHLLGESALHDPDNDNCLSMLTITLHSPCTDCEVRVWVNSDTDLQISMLEIAPWQDEQESTNPEEITTHKAVPNGDPIESSGKLQGTPVVSQAPMEELIHDSQKSNDAVTPKGISKTSVAQNKPRPSSNKRGLTGVKRKKKKH